MRVCPDCEERTLDVSEVPNKYHCWTCGAWWEKIIKTDKLTIRKLKKMEAKFHV